MPAAKLWTVSSPVRPAQSYACREIVDTLVSSVDGMHSESQRSKVEPFHVMDVFAAAAERARTHGDVLSLAAGQPSTRAPEPVLRATRDALDSHLLGYTETLGILPLRQAIAEYHSTRYGITVDGQSSFGFQGKLEDVHDKLDSIVQPVQSQPQSSASGSQGSRRRS